MYDQIFRELDSGAWANANPNRCPCHGLGWFGSDFDTWHRCPLHGKGVPHPEDYSEEDGGPQFDFAGHKLHVHRVAYVRFRDEVVKGGLTRKEFRAQVDALVASRVQGTPTMGDWVDAADDVAEMVFQDAADARAQRMGYSCRLEAAWAAEGAFERQCRDEHLDPDAEARGPLSVDRDSWYRW